MHNIHFIKVVAEDCKDAIDNVEYGINIENDVVDFYGVIGAFNLNNPADYKNANESDYFSIESVIGDNPEHFIRETLNCLNSSVKPLEEIKQELIGLIGKVDDITVKKYEPWRVLFKAKELAGNYLITDLIKQDKYQNEWSEVGLTDFNDEGDSVTHLVLVDFHS